MAIPKVFVSYSHDSQEHKRWVLDLATRLRNTGIDATIDQWELKPGDDLSHFIETHLAQSDYILMVCTDRYVEKANAGIGGVGYEKMIITSDLINNIDSNKVIPIIRQQGTRNVPTFLKTKLFIDFSHNDEFEFNYDELVRTLHNAPLYVKPEIGNKPFPSAPDARPERSGDALRNLMTIIVRDYEGGRNRMPQQQMFEKLGISRILWEMLLREALEKELISRDVQLRIALTEKGKFYAVENNIVTK